MSQLGWKGSLDDAVLVRQIDADHFESRSDVRTR